MPYKVPVATSADELNEVLTDPKSLRALLSDPENFAEYMEDAVTARLSNDKEITAQVEQQTEAFKVDWLKNMKGDREELATRLNLNNPNTRNRIVPNTIYNKAAIGAKHDGVFNTMGDFLHGISLDSYKSAENGLSGKLTTLQNALSSVKPSDGGFLIPEVLRAELLRVSLETAVVRSRARVIPMDSLTVPFPTVDSTSNVSSVYGGITGYWTEEGATLTESKPRFGRVELKANKLVLYVEVPNELLFDARPAMEAFISEVFPEALAWFEDVGLFLGNGVGEPLGFLNAPAAITITRAGAGAVAWADIAKMYARMLPQSLGRAVWIISPDVMSSLLTATLPGGGPILIPVNGGYFDGTNAPAYTLLGRPVIVSEKARSIGNSGDINFVDFGFYLLGDRQAMSAKQSEDFRFNTDLTAFRVIERIDGRPWLRAAITPQNNGTATLSPFVKLNTNP